MAVMFPAHTACVIATVVGDCSYSLDFRGLQKGIWQRLVEALQEPHGTRSALMHALNSKSPYSISMFLDRIRSAYGISYWLVGRLSRLWKLIVQGMMLEE